LKTDGIDINIGDRDILGTCYFEEIRNIKQLCILSTT